MGLVEDVAARCDAVEECYEFMLAYGAQGVVDDRESRSGTQVRQLLAHAAAASELPGAHAGIVRELNPQPAQSYDTFPALLERDAANAVSAMQLVLARPRLSSRLIDNLNASIHLRTVLTDIFLIDEVLAIQRSADTGQGGCPRAGSNAARNGGKQRVAGRWSGIFSPLKWQPPPPIFT